MSSTGRMHPVMKQTEQEVGHSYPLKCTSSIKAVASKDCNFPINSAAGE